MKRFDLFVALVLAAIGASGKLGMETSLLLLLCSWAFGLHGVWAHDVPHGRRTQFALKSLGLTIGLLALAYWFHIPTSTPQLTGQLIALQFLHPRVPLRSIQIGNSPAIIIDFRSQWSGKPLLDFAQNQNLTFSANNGTLAITTKVL